MKQKSLNPFRMNQSGMTLIEIMIVLAIIGGLVAILAQNLAGSLSNAKVKEAKIQMAEVGKKLDMYYTDCSSYPESLEGLMEAPSDCPNWGPNPYAKKIPKDPWGQEFIYELDGANYVLISLGEDKREGGDGAGKDISSEEL